MTAECILVSTHYPVRPHLISGVRRKRDLLIRNHRLFRNRLVHHFVQHHLTVLAARAEHYLACAAVVSVLIARPLLAFRAAQAQPVAPAACAGLGYRLWGFFV